jgi:phosphate transport system substrate-binding protein
MLFPRTGAIGIGLWCVAGMAGATHVSGAGSTFVTPVMTAWASSYEQTSGISVLYQSLGSGMGLNLIRLGTVDFGASDMPLRPAELAAAHLTQFPIAIGGVVPVVHIAGVKAGALRVTGPVLAQIYLGMVTRWNDPTVAAINAGITLPDAAIVVVHRSDGSGTTFNWANYLSKMSPAWKSAVGEGTSLQWPVGIGANGNPGVAAQVVQTPNAIGYVEFAYALKNHLAYTQVQNSAGEFVEPSAESFAAAASDADWKSVPGFDLVLTNAPGKTAWPITATTFALVRSKAGDPTRRQITLSFFRWALEHGRQQASNLGYVPLPPALVLQIEASWMPAKR